MTIRGSPKPQSHILSRTSDEVRSWAKHAEYPMLRGSTFLYSGQTCGFYAALVSAYRIFGLAAVTGLKAMAFYKLQLLTILFFFFFDVCGVQVMTWSACGHAHRALLIP